MVHHILRTLLIGFSVFLMPALYGYAEHIRNYHSDIVIKKNGDLEVKETITVFATGDKIVNGIYRDFPTVYRKGWLRSLVGFRVHRIARNGEGLPFSVESIDYGKRVRMIGGGRLPVPAEYVFTIEYTATRQIGFFDDHDELYWNVVGDGWGFRIEHVCAHVTLPEGVRNDDTKVAAYAGSLGSLAQSYKFTHESGVIVFKYDDRLLPRQAFSVVIGMPKGSIAAPSQLQKTWWTFVDNLDIFFGWLSLFLLLAYILYCYLRVRRLTPEPRVIPLFEPPSGFTPGMIHYFSKRAVAPQGVSADIVNLAVNGWITISTKEAFWSGTTYEITRTENVCLDIPYALFLHKLFGSSQTISFGKEYAKQMLKVNEHLEDCYKKSVIIPFFKKYKDEALIGAVFTFLGVFITATLRGAILGENIFFQMFILTIVSSAIVYTGMLWLLVSYTPEGFIVKDQIEGFKLYLSVAEVDRIALLSTPPDKTPELYEKLLPYAMALGVEKQWTEQFTPIFEKLLRAGEQPTVCAWYHGRGMMRSRDFSSGFAQSLSSGLSSSVSASVPGTQSGFGGSSGRGGGAGGGGGGGGGGGC